MPEKSLLQSALDYARRGFPVFPCDRKKQPIGAAAPNGVYDATTDADKITKWWTRYPEANIGCDVTGAGMMVLDFDPGSDLEATRKELKLPDTKLVQRTPRGGVHLFYAIGEDDRVANSVKKIAEGVDVRGLGGYVCLTPSKTDDGAYSWQSSGKPAYRTDDLLRVCNVAREKSEDRDVWIIEPDLPENVEAAIKWLKRDAKIAVEGQGGDAMAYATAAHMKSFGLSGEKAVEVMWDHWNPRCDPPWGEDEIEHFETKVLNAYSYNTSPPGNITKSYREALLREQFKPVVRQDLASGKEVNAGRFRFVDREGMKHIRPPSWIIPSFIPRNGYVVLFGASGAFKSFVALDAALSISSGAGFPWAGPWGTIEEPGPVLYVLGEGRPGFTKRVRAWEHTHLKGKQVDNFVVADPVPLVTENIDAFIEGALSLHPDGYRAVFIDTIARSMQGVNENAQEHASKFTALVERLLGELADSVVAIQHTGFGNQDRGKGSQEFYGAPDAIFSVARDGKAMHVQVSNPKQKDAPEWEKPLRIDLKEIDLGEGEKSLVAVAPDEKAADAKPARSKSQVKRSDPGLLMILDGAVEKVLAANKLKGWSTRELSETLAMREEIDVESKTLRNSHLIRVRETKGTKSNRFYDPATQRWRWVAV